MDEFDLTHLFAPRQTFEEMVQEYGESLQWYFLFFKRSFVSRRDGAFLSFAHLDKPDVYPLTYAVTDAYMPKNFHFERERDLEIVCTLRGSRGMSTRLRVTDWLTEYIAARGIDATKAVIGQINKGSRNSVSKAYFDQMYSSKIVVTVNPANWEGDFRLWEALASGALVFCDPLFVPHAHPLEDGVHVVYFDNSNKTSLFDRLDYYRANPLEAERVRIAGYLHAMKFHRTVNLVDYVLRSADVKRRGDAALEEARGKHENQQDHGEGGTGASGASGTIGGGRDVAYTYTAQYLNAATRAQRKEILRKRRPGKYRG